MANYGVAALVFGQFVGQRTVSWKLILAGIGLWLALVSLALVVEGDGRRVRMENALLMLGGITLVAAIIVLLDWLGRREDRQSRNRAA